MSRLIQDVVSQSRRPWSYAATVLADLATVVPGGSGLYGDVVNDFLAVDASPVLMRADERRAQGRPDGTGTSCGRCAATCRKAPADASAPRRQDRRPPLPGHGSRRALFSGRGT